MIVHINVTEDLINRGLPEDCMLCPVALAIDAALGDELFTYTVTFSTIYLGYKDGRIFECYHPAEIKNFIVAFDNGIIDGIKPFEADLEFTQME